MMADEEEETAKADPAADTTEADAAAAAAAAAAAVLEKCTTECADANTKLEADVPATDCAVKCATPAGSSTNMIIGVSCAVVGVVLLGFAVRHYRKPAEEEGGAKDMFNAVTKKNTKKVESKETLV
tara:strand:- start:149 stop:526 length:378 start_codon:yes stop_codon:yes gene_type:complete